MKTLTQTSLALVLLGGISAGTSAAIIAPQTGGGAAIDPVGTSDVDSEATGSATLVTFEGLANRVTQVNWSGIGGSTGNTIDGSDVDVRIDHVGGYSTIASTTDNFNTGASTADVYRWSGTNGQQMEIQFGTQGGTFVNDRAVQAAGLVLLNFGGAYTDVTIQYLDAGDNVLSTQNFVGGADPQSDPNTTSAGGQDVFTGYVSGSANIAKITIDLTRNAGNSDIGLDAVTYVVPEPSSLALLGLGGLCAVRRRRS